MKYNIATRDININIIIIRIMRGKSLNYNIQLEIREQGILNSTLIGNYMEVILLLCCSRNQRITRGDGEDTSDTSS